MSNDEETAVLSWRLLALGACGIVITLGGMAVGLWSESLDARLNAILKVQAQQWDLIQQRSSLGPRMDVAERQIESNRQNLRELEQQVWKLRH